MIQLSKNFSLAELCDSRKAVSLGIKNYPSEKEIINLTHLVNNTLQPIRDLLDKPIVTFSGYRCVALNKAVGGSSTSQHLKGQAADFSVKGMQPKDICKLIIDSGIEFDQIIQEFGEWVHISFNQGNNRRSILTAMKVNGKTVYLQGLQ